MFHVWSRILSHLTYWIPAPDSEREIDSAFNSQSDHKAQVSASSITRAFHLVWFVGCTDEGDHAISFQLANVFITNVINDITKILIIFLLPHIGLWDRRSLEGNRTREKEREREGWLSNDVFNVIHLGCLLHLSSKDWDKFQMKSKYFLSPSL